MPADRGARWVALHQDLDQLIGVLTGKVCGAPRGRPMSRGLRGRLRGMPDPAAVARAVLDRNRYLTLATADAAGRPWSSPVWFACEEYRRFWWVSRPGAVHSRNIGGRPEVAAVVFDSTVVPGTAQAVYLRATTAQVDDAHGIEVFSAAAVADGLSPWSMAEVTGAAEMRLYRAEATELSVLGTEPGGRDERISVDLAVAR
jgi:nitroimidazol reductase NimA-like FMN-containing flavoprotein (pyridoxamine 5'-phosphate oxidase superfamily)